MTLIETLLAISITATVGAGIVGMMSALTDGMIAQHDMRSSVLRAGLAQARLSAYVTRSRCLLDLEPQRVVLWLEDADGDEAIDATEVRWIDWTPDRAALSVQWVVDDTGTVLDEPFTDPAGIDWWSTLSSYAKTAGLKVPRLDLAGNVTNWTFESTPTSNGRARRTEAMGRLAVHAAYALAVADDTRDHRIGDSIRMHQPPEGGTP